MVNIPSLKEMVEYLAQEAGLSISYSRQIVHRHRPCPQDVALLLFRRFDVRMGFLAQMTEADIAKLCAQECHGAQDGGADVADQGVNEVNGSGARSTHAGAQRAGVAYGRRPLDGQVAVS